MPRKTRGGTLKYCPNCATIRVCTAVNPGPIAQRSGQRWQMKAHADLQWFRRALICQTCNVQWLTAEINENLLTELVQLRDALKDIKLHTEAYVSEAGKAAKSLEKLSQSLKVLRALKMYTSSK